MTPNSSSSAPAAGLEFARASLERSLALHSVPDVPEASGAALTTLDEDSTPGPADLQYLDGFAAAAGLEQRLLGEAEQPQTDEDIMARSLADARRDLLTGTLQRIPCIVCNCAAVMQFRILGRRPPIGALNTWRISEILHPFYLVSFEQSHI